MNNINSNILIKNQKTPALFHLSDSRSYSEIVRQVNRQSSYLNDDRFDGSMDLIVPSKIDKKEAGKLALKVNSIVKESNSYIKNPAFIVVERFLKTNKKMDIKDFNSYINKIDFEKLYKLAPEMKNYDALELLSFLDYFYKNGISEFDSETLKFKGDLTEFLSKNYLDSKKTADLFSIFPLTDRKIGSIPASWLDCVKEGKKEEAIEKVYRAITKFQKSDKKDKNIKKLEKRISGALEKKVNLEKIDHGAFGQTYKLSSKNSESLCLKIFFDSAQKLGDFTNSHGQFVEPQIGIFNNSHSNKFVKLIFGRVATKNHEDGFLVTQFLDKDIKPYQNKKILKGFTITPKDVGDTRKTSSHNVINGKIIDFGRTEIKKHLPKNLADKFSDIFRGYSKYFVYKK